MALQPTDPVCLRKMFIKGEALMKKIICIVLSLSMLFSLVACGVNGDTDASSQGNSTKTETTSQFEDSAKYASISSCFAKGYFTPPKIVLKAATKAGSDL
mgnify:CR=1 FL=1